MVSRVRIDRVKLSAMMVKADVTAIKLAEKTGLSRGTISNIKQGRSCSEETGQKIADGLGVKLESLL